MIDFSFTDTQLAVRDMAREVAQKVILPDIQKYDRSQEVNPDLIPAMAKANLLGFCIPEEYGGMGTDYIALGLASEELEYGDTSARVILSVHIGLFSLPLLTWRNEEQKQKYLKPLAKGEKLGAFCLSEPGSGSDAAAMKTTAVPKGDHYVLNGTKNFITNGMNADYFVMIAMTDPSQRHKGISAFIVDKDFEGFRVGHKERKLGIRSSDTVSIIMEDCIVPKENLLGEESLGFKIAMKTLDGGRLGIAAQALGIAQGSLEASINYSKERIQ